MTVQKYECPSDRHDHKAGKCDKPATREDKRCDDCREAATKEWDRTQPPQLGEVPGPAAGLSEAVKSTIRQ